MHYDISLVLLATQPNSIFPPIIKFYLLCVINIIFCFQILLRNRDTKLDIKTNDGTTPLILACRLAIEGMVEDLINAEADINATDDAGKTALHWAASVNNVEAVQILINHGANIDIQDNKVRIWRLANYVESCEYMYIEPCNDLSLFNKLCFVNYERFVIFRMRRLSFWLLVREVTKSAEYCWTILLIVT